MAHLPQRLPVSIPALERAAETIGRGGIVAFPTETFYGLAVDPFSRQALEHLFAAKGRDPGKPILVLVRDLAQLALLVSEIPPLYLPLIRQVWPAPLTLIFPARPRLPALLTGGTETVGVRLAAQPAACRLLETVGHPLTATSANLSGQPSQAEPGGVCRQFRDRIDLVLDGGSTTGGLGSTVVGIREGRLRLIRDGAVPFRDLRRLTKGPA